MKKIDNNWLLKIDKVYEKLKSSIPLDSKTSRSTKCILIDRYFKFLNNKFYKLIIPTNADKYANSDEIRCETFYAWFTKSEHTMTYSRDHEGEVFYSYGVQKCNGWNDHEFIISFRDEKLNRQEFKLHWNGILKIQYEEITMEKYWDVVGLFIDLKTPNPE